MNPRLEGLLLIDKPSGPTSHDVVARVRRCLGVRRTGHAGTLDPAARGLLPIVVGVATRLVRFLPGSPKVYRGSIQLGVTTDTDDVTGQVLARAQNPLPPAALVLEAARALEGRSWQVPPVFCARRVDGQRLHRLARLGTPVAAPASEVEVARFELRASGSPDVFGFEAEVSAGTYIRALARDLGQALGCGGALADLERTRIGPMRLEDAVSLPGEGDPAGREKLLAALLPPASMPLGAPACRLDDPAAALRFAHGLAVSEPRGTPGGTTLIGVLHPSGDLLGMAEPRDGFLHPRVVLTRP